MKAKYAHGAPQANRTGSSYLYATATQEPYLRNLYLSCWSSLRFYSIRPIMVRGGGMRGKDESTRIEAFGSPSSTDMPLPRAPSREPWHGHAAAATFDIDPLLDSSNLTVLEAALKLQERDPQGGHPRACRADALLKRTYGLGPAKLSQTKNRGFAKAAPQRKASGPINKWKEL